MIDLSKSGKTPLFLRRYIYVIGFNTIPCQFWQGIYISSWVKQLGVGINLSGKNKNTNEENSENVDIKGGLAMSQNIAKQTEELLQPILDELSLELVDVVYEKEGKNWFLRVYLDKDGGIDIEECGIVSEKLSARLDEEDPIEGAYFLEVSSPGVERPLKKEDDFVKYTGENVYIKLYEPINGEKEFTGKLLQFDNNIAKISYKDKTKTKEVEIPYEKIAKAHLAVIF